MRKEKNTQSTAHAIRCGRSKCVHVLCTRSEQMKNQNESNDEENHIEKGTRRRKNNGSDPKNEPKLAPKSVQSARQFKLH